MKTRKKDHRKVSAGKYYLEYHGHRVEDLKVVYDGLRESTDSLIWTAGDSTLDNKYWFDDHRPAVGPYEDILDPPTCNADVTYWMNYLISLEEQRQRRTASENEETSDDHYHRQHRSAVINTAVEGTTLNERSLFLRPQDRFIRDNLQSNDVLVVSVGGNDVGLASTPCTLLSILSLAAMPAKCLENGCVPSRIPYDDYFYGCGASLLSCACAFPPCLGYMDHLMGVRVQKYIEALTSKIKPKKILVCMAYYPDENHVPSWATPALEALGYNSNPEKLQMLIRRAFVEATSTISIPGSKLIPVPLFHVLDGKDSDDYIARVEPSSTGGRKIAEYLVNIINNSITTTTNADKFAPSLQPSASYYGTFSPDPVPTPIDRPFKMSDRY